MNDHTPADELRQAAAKLDPSAWAASAGATIQLHPDAAAALASLLVAVSYDADDQSLHEPGSERHNHCDRTVCVPAAALMAARVIAAAEAQPAVTPPPALTEEGRLRAQVETLQQDAERGCGLAKVGARCMRVGHQGLIETGRAVIEGHRFALSVKLGLGTGAPWDAIYERVAELRRVADEEQPDTETQAPANSGPGWYEVINPRNATTNITYVHEDGSLYLPEGDALTEGEFAFAAARGHAHRLVRADDVEQPAAGPAQVTDDDEGDELVCVDMCGSCDACGMEPFGTPAEGWREAARFLRRRARASGNRQGALHGAQLIEDELRRRHEAEQLTDSAPQAEQPAAADTDETATQPECAHCWREIENRCAPTMNGPGPDNWVHVPGGFKHCFPQKPDSPLAEPRP